MFEISIAAHFAGAHRLRGYDGPCGNVHGHNWAVEVFVKGPSLDEIGMLADFRMVKKAVRDELEQLDHTDLNSLEALGNMNPTSENLAKYIHERLSERLNCRNFGVSKVRVSETEGSSATYDLE